MTKQNISLSIGALSKACNVSAPTIRYYEKITLLPKAERSRSDQRRYSQDDVKRLNFIRRSRAFGFSTYQIRTLLSVPTGSTTDCESSKEIALDRIKEIRAKVLDLLVLETDLKALIDQCRSTCGSQDDQVCAAFVEMQAPLSSNAL